MAGASAVEMNSRLLNACPVVEKSLVVPPINAQSEFSRQINQRYSIHASLFEWRVVLLMLAIRRENTADM